MPADLGHECGTYPWAGVVVVLDGCMVDIHGGLLIEKMKTHLKDIPDIKARQKAMLDDLVETGRTETDAAYCNNCILGRWLEKDLCAQLDELNDSTVWKIIDWLPAWMQEMDWRFLAEAQSLHDQLPYWDPHSNYKMLSDHGEQFLDLIRRQWELI